MQASFDRRCSLFQPNVPLMLVVFVGLIWTGSPTDGLVQAAPTSRPSSRPTGQPTPTKSPMDEASQGLPERIKKLLRMLRKRPGRQPQYTPPRRAPQYMPPRHAPQYTPPRRAPQPTIGRAPKPTRWKVTVDRKTPLLGSRDAIVTLVVYSDFQCPFCARAATTTHALARQYGTKIRVFFRHYPLDFHKDAHLAAQASLAAHAQGKFWPYHDKLFANQRKLKRPDLERYAADIGLDMKQFRRALDTKRYQGRVDWEIREGKKVAVEGTPTFFVNGRKTSTSRLKQLVKEEYQRSHRYIKRLKGDVYYRILLKGSKQKKPLIDLPIGVSPVKGPNSAPVTLIAFVDIKCPSFILRTGLLELLGKYKGKVRLVVKHNPHHPGSQKLAEATAAAQLLGAFWPFMKKLMAHPKRDEAALLQIATQVGLPEEAFRKWRASAFVKRMIQADITLAKKHQLQNQVALIVNGQLMYGTTGDQELRKKLNRILVNKGIDEKTLPKALLPPGKHIPSKGPAKAPARLIVFSDFQDPFDKRNDRTLRQLMAVYKGKLRLAFKHFPLSFHKQAKAAAIASMAAHAQGKFWPYHDKLFADQRKIRQGRPFFLAIAKELKLDLQAFRAALDAPSTRALVERDIADGGRAGVTGTPSLYLNEKRVSTNMSFKALAREIHKLLVQLGHKLPPPPTSPPTTPIKIKGIPWRGAADAAVTLVVFSDFQCPFCARNARFLKQLVAHFPTELRVVFMHYPLSFHKDAHLAAQASLAAHAQGKFWPYHDKLFANQRKLKRPDLERYAADIGLDMPTFKRVLDKGLYRVEVNRQLRDGNNLDVYSTPTMFLNNRKYKGPYNLDALKRAIRAASKAAKNAPTTAAGQ